MVVEQGERCSDAQMDLPGYNPNYEPNLLQINKLLQAIMVANKPLILAGAGVLHAKASKELTNVLLVNTKFLLCIHYLVLVAFRQMKSFSRDGRNAWFLHS